MKRTVQLFAGVALLGGCLSACRGEQLPTETASQNRPGAVAARLAPAASGLSPAAAQQAPATHESPVEILKELAALRRATVRFHRFKTATAAGWSTKITDCMTDPAGAGGMGFHYGNTALIDGSVSVTSPELLLYEPEKNGGLRLVAVEYIIPYTAHSRDAAPPVLFGQKFLQNDVFQLWGLHAWVWEHNPSGMFANWNPRVTCKYASATSTMAH
jgi:hypothetical protein